MTDQDTDIGRRLKHLREMRGFSQRELARRADITNSALSLIEKNETSPSVAMLRKILETLGLSLSAFFAVEPPAEDQIFFRSEELIRFGKDDGLAFYQIGALKNHKLQIMKEIYAPGADTGGEMLRHEGEEGGIVLTGKIEITCGDQTQVLEPGDAYYYESNKPHRFRNMFEEPCELISACTPPYL